jgi:DsbC/DsbD-like thiol-disulfide interchange protein
VPLLIALLAVAVQAASETTLTVSNPQVSVHAFVEPAVVRPNGDVAIVFEIKPAPKLHVYAPGADYQVVSIKLDPQPGLKPRDVVYPPSEMYLFAPLQELVPVYTKPFRLKQVVTTTAALKSKQALTLTGHLAYQACDDRVCYKPGSIPFRFELKVKR